MARVLLTGCSKGVGLATAVAFAADGWDVVATMRDPVGGGADLRAAADAAGVEVSIGRLDVGDDRSVAAAFDAAGPVDVLINNAAVTQFCSIEETPIEDWQLMLDTNFLGPIRCMRAVMPVMRAQGHGCIVNVSTIAAQVAFAGTGAYASSKAALEQASAIAAIEGRPHGIRVVLVEAGSMATGMRPTGTMANPTSPYWPTIRNSVRYLTANGPAATHPSRIATAIVGLATRTDPGLRHPAGQAAAETLALHRDLGGDGWRELITSPEFEQRYVAPPASPGAH